MEIYIVSWAIQVEASSPENAALMALKEMRNPDSERRMMAVQDLEGNSVILDPLNPDLEIAGQ